MTCLYYGESSVNLYKFYLLKSLNPIFAKHQQAPIVYYALI